MRGGADPCGMTVHESPRWCQRPESVCTAPQPLTRLCPATSSGDFVRRPRPATSSGCAYGSGPTGGRPPVTAPVIVFVRRRASSRVRSRRCPTRFARGPEGGKQDQARTRRATAPPVRSRSREARAARRDLADARSRHEPGDQRPDVRPAGPRPPGRRARPPSAHGQGLGRGSARLSPSCAPRVLGVPSADRHPDRRVPGMRERRRAPGPWTDRGARPYRHGTHPSAAQEAWPGSGLMSRHPLRPRGPHVGGQLESGHRVERHHRRTRRQPTSGRPAGSPAASRAAPATAGPTSGRPAPVIDIGGAISVT